MHANEHRKITTDALGLVSGLQIDSKLLLEANVETDAVQSVSVLHFDNCTFAYGATRINELWERLEDVHSYGPLSPSMECMMFGTLIHAVQDFYSHSNWVELHVAELTTNDSEIPVWDLAEKLPDGIKSGLWITGFPQLCKGDVQSHSELNKDDKGTDESKKIVNRGDTKVTLFELTMDVATRATAVQCDRLRRYHARKQP
jgi:hypothetical protein